MSGCLIAVLLIAASAHAQSIAVTNRGVVVAADGGVQLIKDNARVWAADGVTNTTKLIANDDRAVVLDALANEARVVDLTTGKTTLVRTGETPVDAIFVGRELLILERDARTLTRVSDGKHVRLSADPAFLKSGRVHIYVYSRGDGVLEEIDPDRLVVTRRINVGRHAADVELDGRTAYLLHPRQGRIRTLDLRTLEQGTVEVGAVPVDLGITRGSAVSARTLAIADPSAKRVWIVEGAQSMSEAVARGFLRGLLGLGLFANRDSQFPTGVDRVAVRGSRWIAYDSASGTLYRVTKKQSSVMAKDVAPQAFALTDEGVVYWQDGRLRTAR